MCNNAVHATSIPDGLPSTCPHTRQTSFAVDHYYEATFIARRLSCSNKFAVQNGDADKLQTAVSDVSRTRWLSQPTSQPGTVSHRIPSTSATTIKFNSVIMPSMCGIGIQMMRPTNYVVHAPNGGGRRFAAPKRPASIWRIVCE